MSLRRDTSPPVSMQGAHATAGRRALERANMRTLDGSLLDSRLVRLGVPIFILLIAGLAHFSGASNFISFGLVVAGAASLSLILRGYEVEGHGHSRIEQTEARSRAQVETLADRVWELQESEERFRGLIDALGDLVIHRDRSGRLVYANKVFAELMQRPPQDLVGRTLSDLGIDIGVVPDASFADGEYLSSKDVEIQTPSGPRWFSWIELSVTDRDSRSVSHRAIARDVTSRKHAEGAAILARERAEMASQAKSRFLATVSHEIRTPMNGIIGMAKLLGGTELAAEQRTYVSAVTTSASSLLALIEDLLDYSRIERGRFEPHAQQMSPRELTESVVELLAWRAHEKGIGLGCHIAPEVPASIEADPGRLRQILVNLINNAIKFTEHGGVSVSVKLIGKGKALCFAVADSGPGVPVHDRERIFEEFEQGDGTSTRVHGGVGLGLAISRRLARSMGGDIAVRTRAGKGSLFRFTIPVVRPTSPTNDEPSVLRGRRFMILSQHAREGAVIAETIKAYGGVADLATNETEACGASKAYDAVLIDAALEDRKGSLLTKLRDKGFAESRAVTMITPAERLRLPELKAHGYGPFLARPVRTATLIRVLQASLTLPAGASSRKRPRNGSGKAASNRALRILIAEDNAINALLAGTALSKAGHKIVTVTDGKAAVEAFKAESKFDIVLMDLHMPVMDGADAISAIRDHERASGLAFAPILVLTADDQDLTRESAMTRGATGFVAKPLDPDALVETVERQAASA